MLCLLPIERLELPFRFVVADFALVLLTAYGLGRAWHTRQPLVFPLLPSMWLILLSSLVATLAGSAHPNSITAIVQESYLFVWFIVLTNVLKTLSSLDVDRLMRVWTVLALVEAVTVLMGMLRIGPSLFYVAPGSGRVLSIGGLSRGLGTYVNPNAAAAYLSISFFVLLGTSWPIWLRSACGVWLLLGMLGTGSIGALLSTVGSLVVLAGVYPIVGNRRPTKLWGGILGVGAGVLATMLFVLSLWPSPMPGAGFDTQGHLFALTLGRLPRALASRFTLVEEAWSAFSLNPLGSGPNTSVLYGGTLHNDYAAFLFERGPLGAIGWLFVVGSTLFTPLGAAQQSSDRHQRRRMLALGAGFLACAVNALTHEVSHFRQVWVLMAFLFAVSYAPSPRRTDTFPSKGIEP
jgi:hypothetical protein